jgi:hypothetical protein
MAALEQCVLPDKPYRFQIEFQKSRARFGKRKEPSPHVMNETRQRELFGAQGPSRPFAVGFDDQDAKASSRQNTCRDQTVGTRADDDDIRIVFGHLATLATFRVVSSPEPTSATDASAELANSARKSSGSQHNPAISMALNTCYKRQ